MSLLLDIIMATPRIVRALFEEKLNSSVVHPSRKFHPRDLERVNDDKYLMRIIAHTENNAQHAANMLWDILVWRKNVGASDINETNIRMDYVNEGSIFPYGRDIDGCLLLVFKFKIYFKYKKDFEEVKKILIYWLDRIEREENGNKISVFCDMSDHGVTDFDITLSTYTISLFHKYYPHFLNYLVIFQMHWSLTPTFKMVKSLFPPRSASRIKLVTKNTLFKVVQLDHALKSWGGRDIYEFKFVPENKSKISQIIERKSYAGEMVKLKPNKSIFFKESNNKLTFCMLLTITNVYNSAIFFEMRTTNPEIFCVNPNSGTLDIAKSKSVVIVVQDYFDSMTLNTMTLEKFMIIAIQIPTTEVTKEHLYEIWQTSPEFKVQEYTFNRLLNEVEDDSTIVAKSLSDLRVNNQVIQNQLHFLKLYQLLTLVVVACAALGFCFQHLWS